MSLKAITLLLFAMLSLCQRADAQSAPADRVLSVTKTADAAEPSAGGNFVISLPAGINATANITVNYSITGTAINGLDYTTPSGIAVIPVGQQSVSLPVTATDDQIIEGTETVILTVTSGTNGSAPFTPSATNASATLDLTDNDNTATNQVVRVTKTADASEPATNGAFSVSLPAGYTSSSSIQVTYTIGAGSAAAGTDYRAITGAIVIPAGQNSVSVPVTIIDNTIIESPAETVILNISGGNDTQSAYTVAPGGGSATVNIGDNDFNGASNLVQITKISDCIEGGTNGQYRIALKPGVTSSQDITISFTMSGTAASGTDYNLLGTSGGNIIIPAGANEVIIEADAPNDGIIEGPKSVVMNLVSAASSSYPFTINPALNGATVNIVDANAVSSTPVQVLTGSNAAEPSTNASFTVKLAGVATSAWPVTVAYRLSGDAMPGLDYTLQGSVVIPANQNSVSVPLNVNDDQIFEKAETMTIVLLSGSATDGGGNAFIFPPDPANLQITVNIADNDATAANQVLKVVKTTDAAEQNPNGIFTVSLPPGYTSSGNMTLSYTMTGTAIRNRDYNIFAITLPVYSNSIAIPLSVIDDQIIEQTETAVLNLNGATDGNAFTYSADPAANQASMNITDNDNTPENRILLVTNFADAAEPSVNGSFHINLPAGITAAEDITVNYTVGGTATTGTDYAALTGSAVIPAGQNGVAVPVNVQDDQTLEGTETVSLTVTGGASANFNFTPATGRATATVNLADDENTPANLTLAIAQTADATEGGANGAFSISLPPNILAGEAINVQYTITGTAQNGVDYTVLNGTVTLPAGQNSVSLPVTAIDDQFIEGTEAVIATLNGGTNPALDFTGNGNATVNIADNDDTPANLTLNVSDTADAVEGGDIGGFSVSLPAGITVTEPVTVNYTVSGTATAGTDYITLTGTVVIPAGQNSAAVPVTTVDDQVIEPGETVILTLNGGSSANHTFTGTGSATVSIADNDNIAANRVLSVVKETDVAETATNGTFRVSLPAGITAAEDINVTYTVAGTAISGTDYTALSGAVQIPAGLNSAVVTVPVIDDQIIETTESVIITLSGGASASFNFTASATNGATTVDVLDNDNDPLNLVVSAISLSNGAEPATNGSFSLTLPTGFTTSEDVTVNYTVSGTATAGTDYTALNGTAVIPAGQTSMQLPVTVIDDQLIEKTENVVLTVTAAASTNFTFAPHITKYKDSLDIVDDESHTPASLALSVNNAADAAEPGINSSFNISLAPGITSTEDVTVNYAISGTAVNGTDYNVSGVSVVIPAGQTSATVPVTVINDQIIEGSETVVLTLNGGTSPSFIFNGTGNATVNIADDDDNAANRTLAVTKTADAAEPAANGNFDISLPAGITASEDITVNYTVNGTATAGTDYTAFSGTAMITAGQHSVSIPLAVTDDNIIEPLETVTLTLTGGTSASFTFTGTGNATANIADNEINLALSVTKGTDAAEPATNGSFNISLPAGITSSENITVNYTISGTATAGTDYSTLSGSVVIPAGQNSVNLPLTVTDDNLIEGNETVILAISSVTAPGLTFTTGPNNTAALNITDDDNINLELAAGANQPNAAEPSTTGAFSISLASAKIPQEDITVTYTVAGTATAGTDYNTLSGTVVIPAGQNTVTVPVNIINDNLIEQAEAVVLTITGGTSASLTYPPGVNNTATVNIADDDDTPANRVLSITNTADAAEPSTNGSFKISLPAGITASENITVNYTVSGTATAGTDYTALSGTAVITAGQNSVSIPMAVIDDNALEGIETVTLGLTGGTSASFTFTGTGNATANIIDNETNLVLSAAKGADGAEPATNGSFNINLPAGLTSFTDITVNYAITGTAGAGTDYTALTGSAVISVGQNSVNIPVPVKDDQLIEASETVILTITGAAAPGLTFTTGPNNAATLNIADDDNTAANLVLNVTKTADAAEPSTNGSFTISLLNGKHTVDAIAIQYMSGGSATPDADYQAITSAITIPAGGSSVTVPVTVTDDDEVETPETVVLTLTGGRSASYAFTPGTSNEATVTITSEDILRGNILITKEVVQPAVGPYRLGQDLTYRISIRNKGATVVPGIKAQDQLPGQLDQPSHTSAERGEITVTPNSRLIEWNVGDLAPGATVEMTLTARLIGSGEVINTASAYGNIPDADSTDNIASSNINVQGDDLFFPNGISPNGDGKNEKFIIGGLEKYPGSALYIFNRWGGQVYQSKDYRNDWTGAGLSEGTYYYVLEVRHPDGIKKYKGWVTLVR
ncbi:T9SS type B sorting domain-containing protein [Chitinophaga agrisoli]|uniref:T9SS type B sorting domain-containing protein n=1 Tax=Chitinophaga agrisoli TaxID=2607653 RepID=A0A5B2VQE0_9BACT|nr:Calx-beta domain-containing protein [Chitinophaga agrisoli]KAA2240329.1 T9SS type B sorting domain-containing protein [Chitinophaga agrisoli]